jgi:antitoxin component YwqK of YwqJK toxin-antitoxin module
LALVFLVATFSACSRKELREEKYASGALKSRGYVNQDAEKNYISTGLWVYWYENGQKKAEGTFKDGKLEGPYTSWYENGQKKAEANYKDGKLEGLVTLWYESGKKKSESTYNDGKQQGHSTTWFSADIMLITSDRADVDCAAATGIGEYRCGFSDEKTPWNGDEQKKLKPFYTTDRHLYLVPGLFLQPALQDRYKAEPPDKPRDLLKRFTAKCNLKAAGKMGGVRTRWLASGTWSTPEEVEVATVVDCKVDG